MREFVLTHVILAPGAHGRGVRAAVDDTTSVTAVTAVNRGDIRDEFQKRRFCCYTHDLRARDLPPHLRDPKGITGALKATSGTKKRPLGPHLGRLWVHLGFIWPPWGALWPTLGPLGAHFGRLWAHLGHTWGLYIHKLPINRPSRRYVKGADDWCTVMITAPQ